MHTIVSDEIKKGFRMWWTGCGWSDRKRNATRYRSLAEVIPTLERMGRDGVKAGYLTA